MKVYILLAATWLSTNVLYAQQWHLMNSGTTNNITCMHFKNADTGFYLTHKGEIFATHNGGLKWAFLYQDSSLLWETSIMASNDSLFYLGKNKEGSPVKIAISLNKHTVVKQTALSYTSPTTIWNHEIWDLGRVRKSLGEMANIENFSIYKSFISASDHSNIYYSNNVGKTWSKKKFTTSLLSSGPYQSFYRGGNTLITTTQYPTLLHISVDKGNTWDTKYLPDGLFLYFLDEANILAFNFLLPTKKLYTSHNLGSSFSETEVNHYISNIYFATPNIGFVYGSNGMIYKTDNASGLLKKKKKKRKKISPQKRR